MLKIMKEQHGTEVQKVNQLEQNSILFILT